MTEAFDFRRVDPSAVRVAKTATRTLFPLVPRVPVQLPRVPVRISLGNFGYNVLARFSRDAPSHAAFCDWIDRVDATVAGSLDPPPREGEWTPSLKGYGDSRNLYLTIGTDAVVFAEDSQLFEASPTTLQFADILCEIQGAWRKSDQCGLRWRVVQVMAASSGPRYTPPMPKFEEDEDFDYSSILKPEFDEDRVFKKRRTEPTMLFVDE